MTSWLAANWGLIVATAAALAGGWVGLNRKRSRELRECRRKSEAQAKTIQRFRREYTQVLEFNFQDRYTIRKLANMVADLRARAGLPQVDILLAVYNEADREMRARQLSAQHDSITRTKSPEEDLLGLDDKP